MEPIHAKEHYPFLIEYIFSLSTTRWMDVYDVQVKIS